MIFVITGSEAFPFDRLIKEIDYMKKNKVIKTDVFIQLGSCSYIPHHCKYEKWLPFNEMREKIAASELVISHAGAGTTLLCLEMGKKPLLVTRLKKHGEHIDNHQVQFAKMMEKLDYATIAYDVTELLILFKSLNKSDFQILTENNERKKLITALGDWLNNSSNKTIV